MFGFLCFNCTSEGNGSQGISYASKLVELVCLSHSCVKCVRSFLMCSKWRKYRRKRKCSPKRLFLLLSQAWAYIINKLMVFDRIEAGEWQRVRESENVMDGWSGMWKLVKQHYRQHYWYPKPHICIRFRCFVGTSPHVIWVFALLAPSVSHSHSVILPLLLPLAIFLALYRSITLYVCCLSIRATVNKSVGLINVSQFLLLLLLLLRRRKENCDTEFRWNILCGFCSVPHS